MNKRLERIADQAQIGGVCAGLADYFGIDRALVRVLFVIGIFLPHFPAIIIYIILWIALPERHSDGYVAQSTAFSNPYFSMNPYNPNKPASPDRSIIGGAVLILLGIMFLIDRYFDIDFGDLWPFLLIAIGIWLIFRDRIKPPYDNTTNYGDTTNNDPNGTL
ncbi:PspC domain-containing protein [Spirosoma validum]|uniref:PspC domain-containing protein n=1 Tax=Spirosoma validum TaxID=2771355 RepID=A0A927GEP6_9BACT|nr:PspC domain-containing protein [Spirosoma validum]MBD2755047.1 PspC domain-containing protein [Spirosoma validum]